MNRLHALTDGVYAIAMTLLVLELHVPDARSSAELVSGLAALAPSLFGFALSFAVLGTYWVGNAVNLGHLARVDRATLFLNVLQLTSSRSSHSRRRSSDVIRARPPR